MDGKMLVPLRTDFGELAVVQEVLVDGLLLAGTGAGRALPFGSARKDVCAVPSKGDRVHVPAIIGLVKARFDLERQGAFLAVIEDSQEHSL